VGAFRSSFPPKTRIPVNLKRKGPVFSCHSEKLERIFFSAPLEKKNSTDPHLNRSGQGGFKSSKSVSDLSGTVTTLLYNI